MLNTEDQRNTSLGFARRVHVRMPFGARRRAWDCRPFGFGRVITPVMTGTVEITPGITLNLKSGELHGHVGRYAIEGAA